MLPIYRRYVRFHNPEVMLYISLQKSYYILHHISYVTHLQKLCYPFAEVMLYIILWTSCYISYNRNYVRLYNPPFIYHITEAMLIITSQSYVDSTFQKLC